MLALRLSMQGRLMTRSLPQFILCVLLTLLAGEIASAQSRRTVVRAGHLLDVKTGQTLSGQAIVIEGDKIVSVGPAGDVKPGADVRIIDLPNATVLPGLIDAHTHLTYAVDDIGY